MSRDSPEYVHVGTVVGSHGYDGRVRIQPESDNPDRFSPGSVLTIETTTYTVATVASHSDGVLLVKLENLDTKEDASDLLHQKLLVPMSEVPPAPEGAFYHYHLIDMAVVTDKGEPLGTITEVISTGANDVYVVTSIESEMMVPALGDVVLSVDVEAGRMTVAVPEGLLPRSIIPKIKNKPPRRQPRKPRPKTNPS